MIKQQITEEFETYRGCYAIEYVIFEDGSHRGYEWKISYEPIVKKYHILGRFNEHCFNDGEGVLAVYIEIDPTETPRTYFMLSKYKDELELVIDVIVKEKIIAAECYRFYRFQEHDCKIQYL